MSRAVRLIRNIVIVAAVSVALAGGIALAWSAIGGGDLPVHGWIALLLGVFGTVAMAWGLMALAFRSNREGWDDRADAVFDPDDKP